ncbi:outer membrane beta-barrel protein [Prevotella sp. 10(H)]|uniref:outer membrane beta-barrel protein n=1 Tax=Prevotella sp. 10(H) TaxID=1158294 RepID=UPI001E528603
MNDSNLPVEAVTCILKDVQDSLYMKTVISDTNGLFIFNELQQGDYMLTLQHMAYEKEEQAVRLENTDVELLPFVLISLDKSLNEVVVSAERPTVKAEEGKLIYNVPQLIRNKAVSNAFETLQNVPGITGTGDNLQLVGTTEYTILVNGQLTSMSAEQLISMLKSMPASRVTNVEVMYSAPPQYNIRGAAINVILKDSDVVPVLQGEGTVEYKQAFYAAYTLRGSLMYSKSSFNADLIVGANKSKGWGESDMYAIHQLNNHIYDISQSNKSRSDYKDINIRLGMGYTFSNKDKISFVYTSNLDDTNSKPFSRTVFLEDSNPYSDVHSGSDIKGNTSLHNIKVEYNSHKKINAGIDYTVYRDPADEKYYDYLNGTQLQTAFKTKTNQKVDKLVAFLNHNTAINGWKLDYGANFSFSKNNNIYNYYKNPDSNHVDSVSDNRQKEYSGSVFFGFSKSFGEKLSLQASLSANYFRATIDMTDISKTLWDDFQPFVNANLTYTYNPKRIVQLSFSSDIDYPPYWALSSNAFKINAYSQVQGNPELKFSKKYNTQLNFIMNQKYVAGAYINVRPDRYIQLPYQSQNSLQNVFQMVNLNYERQYGLYFVVPVKIGNIWDASATVNLIRQEEKDDDFYNIPYSRSKNVVVGQLRNTFNVSSKPDIKLDVSGFYMSGAVQGIYDVGRIWNVSAGAKWTFAGKNAELMFRVDDVFKSGKQTTKIDYMNQYSTMHIKPNAPVFRLSFTYRFGNYKKPKIEEVDTSRFGR